MAVGSVQWRKNQTGIRMYQYGHLIGVRSFIICRHGERRCGARLRQEELLPRRSSLTEGILSSAAWRMRFRNLDVGRILQCLPEYPRRPATTCSKQSYCDRDDGEFAYVFPDRLVADGGGRSSLNMAEEMEAHIVARDAETEGAASYAQTVTIAATVGTCCSAQFYLL